MVSLSNHEVADAKPNSSSWFDKLTMRMNRNSLQL
jgi:hypothetical protein